MGRPRGEPGFFIFEPARRAICRSRRDISIGRCLIPRAAERNLRPRGGIGVRASGRASEPGQAGGRGTVNNRRADRELRQAVKVI